MFKRAVIGVAIVAVVSLLAGAYVAGAFGGDDGGGDKTQRVLAPVDDIAVETPVEGTEYHVRVTAGLPDSCHEADGYDIERDGRTIRVRVYNTAPSDGRACAEVYGIYELSIGLGTDLQTGAEYTVDVNGKTVSFVESVSTGSK